MYRIIDCFHKMEMDSKKHSYPAVPLHVTKFLDHLSTDRDVPNYPIPTQSMPSGMC